MFIQKLIYLTLFTFYIGEACHAQDDGLGFENAEQSSTRPQLSVLTTPNPDDIYTAILDKENCEQTALIIDVDGTLTNEEDPTRLLINQKVTQKGKAVENIRALTQKGATVIFCSAWHELEATKKRLTDIGFTDDDLGITKETASASGEEKITIKDQSEPARVYFRQHGRVISTKLAWSGGPFFRNKAFSFYLLNPANIQTIYFIDDSAHNTKVFKEDCIFYNLFSNQSVYLYNIVN